MHGCKKGKQTKPPMITFANTRADPRAVMIVDFNTSFAAAAMEAAWWLNNMACSAHIQADFFILDHRVVIVFGQSPSCYLALFILELCRWIQ